MLLAVNYSKKTLRPEGGEYIENREERAHGASGYFAEFLEELYMTTIDFTRNARL